jgi:hypothetical protein
MAYDDPDLTDLEIAQRTGSSPRTVQRTRERARARKPAIKRVLGLD